MKSFIYGIDGGDKRIFDYFDMPFYKKLERDYVHIPLKEDLLNRGWSEIITGAEGKDTGGFYMSPELDGTTKLSMKFKMGDVHEKTGIPLIWDMLPQGTKVGIMNVPSLLPVVHVNGFCVGSAGAGISKINEITEELAFPESARDYLEEQGYIPDIRLNSSGIKDVDEWFSRLKEMEIKRVKCFIELSRRFDIDFGLLIDRGTTVIQYLFLSEITSMMERDAGGAPEFLPTPKVESYLRDYYSFLDRNIKELHDSLRPQQFILSADHGHEPMLYHCNPNVLLEVNGLYASTFPKEGLLKKIEKFLVAKLPLKIRKRIRTLLRIVNSKGRPRLERYEMFDEGKTMAFSHFHMPGIYLNDERFGGIVSEENRESLINKICEIFNHNPQSIEHGIIAKPYRNQYCGARYNKKLPDIRLYLPDNMFPTCRGVRYIEKNPVYGSVPNFDKVGSEMHTGTKGSVPICLVDPGTSDFLSGDDANNLTVIYKLVGRFFGRT